MVGANPLVSHGSVLSAPRVRERLLEIEARGGRVVCVDPRRSETAEPVRAPADPARRRRLAAAVDDPHDLRGGAGRRGLPRRARTDGWQELRALAPPTIRRRRPRRARASPPERRARAGARLRGLGVRGRIRSHGRLPGPLRHAGGLPARRAERGDRATSTARAAACSADPPIPIDDDRRADRAGHLRRGPRALRRLPRRARRDAGRRSSRWRSPRPASARCGRCSCPPATRCCRCPTATRWRPRSGSST